MTRPSHWGQLSQLKLSRVWVFSCFMCAHERLTTCRRYRFKLNSDDRLGCCKDFRIKNEFASVFMKIQREGAQQLLGDTTSQTSVELVK
jgi:hypothetical protein